MANFAVNFGYLSGVFLACFFLKVVFRFGDIVLELRLWVHKAFVVPRALSIAVRSLGLRHALKSAWFSRAIFFASIVSAAAVYFLFKDIELIVHGTLYSYGLIFSPDWADPFRLVTWLVYVCLVLPAALSVVGLISSFIREKERGPAKRIVAEQKVKPITPVAREALKVGAGKEEPKVVAGSEEAKVVAGSEELKVVAGKEEPKIVGNNNADGIHCPNCGKVFSRALVMLDFRGGKHKLVSVCPYCNYVLDTRDEGGLSGVVDMANAREKLTH